VGKVKSNSKLGMSMIVKLVVAVLLFFFLIFSVRVELNSHVEKISINIKSRNDKKYLVSKKEVKDILSNELGYDLSLANVSKLDLYELEKLLVDDDRISRAELYLDKHKQLHIAVLQNLPIVRIEVTGGEDYYLDATGAKVPLSGDTHRVPIVTGHVDKYDRNFLSKPKNNLNYIYSVALEIFEDEFLDALVSQININEENEITLVPLLGRQIITLGPEDGLDKKMNKLKIYYKEGFLNIGVNKFKELNLSYEGQIVGVKKES